MYITKVVLKNVRCFEDATLNLESEEGETTMWTVVVGDNGDGKTSLLRAIAMGLCDESSAAALHREIAGGLVRKGRKHASIKIHLTSKKDSSKESLHYEINTAIESLPAFERVTQEVFEIKGKKRAKKDQRSFPWKQIFVSGYGAAREMEGTAHFQKYVAVDAVYTLFRYEEPLQNPELAFRRLVDHARTLAGKDPNKRERRAEATRERLAGLLKDVLNIESGGRVILASKGIEVEGPWGRAALGSVGDGYQSTITWVLDLFAWKMLSGRSLDPKKMFGIVLIDEIEQHLHPRWQRRIIQLLHDQFPNIQFITTTHSPLCAAGTADVSEDGARLALVKRDEDKSVALVDDLPSLDGWRADEVLASEVFGYLIETNPGYEASLREASILGGRGEKRTRDDDARYEKVKERLKGGLIGSRQTRIERDKESEQHQEMKSEIAKLEERLFGGTG